MISDFRNHFPSPIPEQPCRACHQAFVPPARPTEIILTTGERRPYHHRCLQRVARMPGPFPLKAA